MALLVGTTLVIGNMPSSASSDMEKPNVQHQENTTADDGVHELSADERLLHSLGYKQVMIAFKDFETMQSKKITDQTFDLQKGFEPWPI
ncbi:hypothetical protein NQZ79_g4471 [Umbelopsis isabellina]|nr:hypothetical protein NQZ79_g4471 [Umbelopsis isabellina]